MSTHPGEFSIGNSSVILRNSDIDTAYECTSIGTSNLTLIDSSINCQAREDDFHISASTLNLTRSTLSTSTQGYVGVGNFFISDSAIRATQSSILVGGYGEPLPYLNVTNSTMHFHNSSCQGFPLSLGGALHIIGGSLHIGECIRPDGWHDEATDAIQSRRHEREKLKTMRGQETIPV